VRPIFINGRFLTQRITGTQRYGHELLNQLDLQLEKIMAESSAMAIPAVTLLVPSAVQSLPVLRSIRVRQVGISNGHSWEQFELPFHARGGVLFSMLAGAPLLHSRNILTLHDAAVAAMPGSFSTMFRLWYGFLYRSLCHTASLLLTVSNFSRDEIVRCYGANPEKIVVTYLGSEHILRVQPDPTILARKQLRPRKYILAVSSRNPSKNMGRLLTAIALLRDSDLDLAIAGPSYAKVFGAHEIAGERVHDLGYVSDAELRSLYENAACFAFPSIYEGFGLPPLEALALGCPTVVANGSSLREIFTEVAFLCDPMNPEDIAQKMLEATHALEHDRARYREFAQRFRWDQCASVTWSKLLQYANAR
jgi:glycosyltransferase involved in cell wall biosynthesis